MDEGKCLGLVEGEVVISSEDITEVMKVLKNYPNKEVTLWSVPESDRVLVGRGG